MKRKYKIFLVYAIALLTLDFPVAADIPYLGGPYDGYDARSDRVAIGAPHVNNAYGATNVTTAHAWLNGVLVDDGGNPADVFVFWGLVDGVTQPNDWQYTNALGTQAAGASLTVQVAVDQNAEYFYRFYATNTAGATGWASMTDEFLTPSPPAVNTGVGAAPVSYETAALHGEMTAGIAADIFVFWDPIDQGENFTWAHTNDFGELGHGPFEIRISGLTPGTEYSYICYATNPFGAVWSEVVVFTTQVSSVSFYGGAYDGYDRSIVTDQMRSNAGTMFLFR